MPQLKDLRWHLEVVQVAAFDFAGVSKVEEEEEEEGRDKERSRRKGEFVERRRHPKVSPRGRQRLD